jgi:hypothetical protein
LPSIEEVDMAEEPSTTLSPELEESLARATEFGDDPGLAGAFRDASADERSWEEASRDPVGFLSERGVEIPKGLGIEFLDDPLRGRPVPDYEFFTIRLTRCRTWYVKKKDGPGYEKVEVCFGWEIVPNPLPLGPV